MDAKAIQKYDECQMKIAYFGFDLTAKGNNIIIYNKGNLLGIFDNIDQVYSFLCGIDVGKSLVPKEMYWKDRYVVAKDMLKDALVFLPCKTQEHNDLITAIGIELDMDHNK